jgi:hypothetical protein
MNQGSQIQATVSALISYLRANPDASDTAEGIHRWWLDTKLVITMEQLEIAVGWLCKRRAIEEVRALDGRLRYRRIASDALLDELLRDAPQN